LVPIIDRVFEFEKIAEAHKYMESNANIGKILIKIHNDEKRENSDL
jgi:tumor protein p53-inducible protein 3